MSEQRQIRRHPAAILRVTFEQPTSGERAEAIAWDASLGGMFLETIAPVDEGALVTLEITTVDAKVSADARVLWRRAKSEGTNQPAGMAVRFIDLPDDVSVALNRALQSGMAEKTILGIGGATQEPTQPGIMPGADPVTPPQRVPRETQIGVAPPANPPGKPRLVISETSLPETPAAPAVARPRRAEQKAEAEAVPATAPAASEPTKSRRSTPSSEPPPPPGTGGVFGKVLLLLVLAGGAGAVYVYRDAIAEQLAGEAPSAPTAPTADSAMPPATEPDDAALADVEPTALAAAANIADGSASTVDAATPLDAGLSEDAGVRDAGARDAGRDSGAHGGGRHDAGRAPKH